MEEPEFRDFVKTLHTISLHFCLSDPKIEMPFIQDFEFRRFKKASFYCIDGFPKESLPCVVVYPSPMRGQYVYQGIKPAVITLPDADDEIMEKADAREAELEAEKEEKVKRRESNVSQLAKEEESSGSDDLERAEEEVKREA